MRNPLCGCLTWRAPKGIPKPDPENVFRHPQGPPTPHETSVHVEVKGLFHPRATKGRTCTAHLGPISGFRRIQWYIMVEYSFSFIPPASNNQLAALLFANQGDIDALASSTQTTWHPKTDPDWLNHAPKSKTKSADPSASCVCARKEANGSRWAWKQRVASVSSDYTQ